MVDNFLRGLVNKEWKIGRITIGFLDILLLVFATVFGCAIRFSLRNVVAGDYKMFFEPWVGVEMITSSPRILFASLSIVTPR